MGLETSAFEAWVTEREGAGLVKICGLREPAHAVAAAEAGADLIGFIFAPTRRQVSPVVARGCIEAAREATDRRVMAVGVFVNESATKINQIAAEAQLDLIQLHGDEPPDFVDDLDLPVISGLRPRAEMTRGEIDALVRARMARLVPPVFLLVDGHDPNAPGGTGHRADWSLVADLAKRARLLLAGGLDPTNVAAAIGQVQPFGVDVSSGVETDGVKDPAKIAAFVAAARAAFATARLGC